MIGIIGAMDVEVELLVSKLQKKKKRRLLIIIFIVAL